MELEVYPTYSDTVQHISLLFNKKERAGYVGDWSLEWKEMLVQLQEYINSQLLTQGKGILDINITKLDPSDGYIFSADIIYWNHP